MSDNTVLLAALGLLGSSQAGFFALLARQNKTSDKLSKSLDKNTNSNRDIAKAVTKQSSESEKRNGHLGTLIVSQGEQTKAIAEVATDKVIEAVQNVKEQHVEHVHVEKEVVKHKIEPKK